MAKTIKNPNKTIRNIVTVICIFLLAIGAAIAGAVNTQYRWIGVGLIVLSVVTFITVWIVYYKKHKAFVKYTSQQPKETKEVCSVEPQENNTGLTKNFSWIFNVESIQGSPIQFATDPKLKSALECLEQARSDINYKSNLESYKDIELNNINIYIRQVLEWSLKFIKFNDKNFKKWKTYFTIFDGKKIVHDTDFVINDNDRNLTTQWNITSHENGVYTYTGKFQTGKLFYVQSFKKMVGREAITVWHRDETTGAPFLDKWAKMYPDDHVVALIKDVCLDIYRTTSKVIHASEEARRAINQVYSKYYKDENVSDKAKALLVAKAMFHQTRYVLWYVANKYSLYEKEFEPLDISVYKSK